MKAAECDNGAALDGHVLTGSVAGDEQKDTHSSLLLRPKNIQIGCPVRLGMSIHKVGITSQATLTLLKSSRWAAPVHFSAGSQSQLVAGITSSEPVLHEPQQIQRR